MPRGIQKSVKNRKKAYQREKGKRKVCPGASERARKTGKGHTREKKERKKYAPSNPKEQEKQEKGIPENESKGKSMPRAV